MKLIKENITRKMDNLGRISVPKSLRDKFEIADGDEIEFFTTDNGYIAFGKKERQDDRLEMVADILDELNIEVPEKLLRLLRNGSGR